MKAICTLVLCVALFTATNTSAQNNISIDLEPFHALRVSGRIDVELIPSDSKEMLITSKNGQAEEVKVELKQGELSIRIRPRINKNDEFSIRIPYQSLSRIESLAGAVINSAQNLDAEILELSAATGGKIELSVNAGSIQAKITQISDIILYGKTNAQNIICHTGGNYLAYDLSSEEAYIRVSSGSQAKITASKIVKASASSGGYIAYIGDPESVYIKTSLGGEIVSFKSKPDENGQ